VSFDVALGDGVGAAGRQQAGPGSVKEIQRRAGQGRPRHGPGAVVMDTPPSPPRAEVASCAQARPRPGHRPRCGEASRAGFYPPYLVLKAVQPMSREVLIGVESLTPPRPALSPVTDHVADNVEPTAPQEG